MLSEEQNMPMIAGVHTDRFEKNACISTDSTAAKDSPST